MAAHGSVALCGVGGALTLDVELANARLISRCPEMAAALKDCADELEQEINARASGELPRRIMRDMQTVKLARALLEAAGVE